MRRLFFEKSHSQQKTKKSQAATRGRSGGYDFSKTAVIREAIKTKQLPPEEQLKLVGLAQEGDAKARDMLIKTNLRYLMYRVCRFRYDSRIDPEDLLSAAMEGMNQAIDKFDLRRNNRFVTYACWWVDAVMRRFIQDTHSTVRVPKKKKKVQGPPVQIVYMDQPLQGESIDDVTLGDALKICSELPSPEEETIQSDSARAARLRIEELCCKLTPFQKLVVQRRLLTADPDSLTAIGEETQVSRERVRQVQARVLDRIAIRAGSDLRHKEILLNLELGNVPGQQQKKDKTA